MAQFTKQVPFTAYRFLPEELTEWQRDYTEDVLAAELGFEVIDAEVGDDGNLHVKYYSYEKEYVAVKPGEWLVAPEMKVYTDEAFREFATAVL